MRKIGEAIRILLVSFETIWVLVMLYLMCQQGRFLALLGKNIFENDESRQVITALPFTLCGAACFLSFKLLAPKDGSNKMLYDWPDYWRLEYRRNIGIFWCGVSCALVLISMIFHKELGLLWVGGLLFSSVGLAVISSASLLFGAFVLKQIVEE